MKFLIALLLTSWVMVSTVQAENLCAYSKDQITGGGGFPWPWNKELKFPWVKLQGTWETSSDDCSALFHFDVAPANPNTGERFIKIMQINPATCAVVAKGVGQESGRVVKALMVGNNKKFELTIRAFSEEDVRTSGGFFVDPKNGKFRVVLSLYPRDSWTKQISYEMDRIQAGKDPACEKSSMH